MPCIFIFLLLPLWGCAAVVFWRLRRHLADALWMQKARLFLALEMIWTFFLLSAAFQNDCVCETSSIGVLSFLGHGVLSVMGKIFFKQFSIFLRRAIHYFHTSAIRLEFLAQMIFPVLLVLMLYVPDAQGVIARNFLGEQFHHWDSAVMSPGWAYLSGCVLNVDVISQYGLGLPIFMAQLTKFLGDSATRMFYGSWYGCEYYLLPGMVLAVALLA